jgi:phosphoethanolamine N-methyltransferase
MDVGERGELYGENLVGMLEMVWGEGFLSPGGPEEVARLIAGVDLADKRVLDIGCGVGGIDVLIATRYRAGHITAIDVEEGVLALARRRAAARGLAGTIEFVKVAPGPLPFPDAAFDVVFSKDSIVHVPDKHALMREVFRVLVPGGRFVASDWLIGHDGAPSAAMAAYIAAEGLDFGMASPARYLDALRKAGFVDIEMTNRNRWYRDMARKELMAMKGELYEEAARRLGKDFVDHNIAIWERMIPVLDSGEHCPHHLRARKPD